MNTEKFNQKMEGYMVAPRKLLEINGLANYLHTELKVNLEEVYITKETRGKIIEIKDVYPTSTLVVMTPDDAPQYRISATYDDDAKVPYSDNGRLVRVIYSCLGKSGDKEECEVIRYSMLYSEELYDRYMQETKKEHKTR
jgi:hypothetical protein